MQTNNSMPTQIKAEPLQYMNNERPTRIRTKPLQYWNNERIHYNFYGDISFVESSNSVLSKNLNGSKKNNANRPIGTILGLPPKILNTKSKTSTSSREGGKLHENELSRDPRPETQISSNGTNSSVPVDISNLNACAKGRKGGNLHENKLSRNPKPETQISSNRTNSSVPVDISNLNACAKDIEIFNLKSMYYVKNEAGEFYFEKGPFDSRTGLTTAFIFIISPSFHWGSISISREIIVIEGDAILEYIVKEKTISKDLHKGSKYEIMPGGDLFLRKAAGSAILKLFVLCSNSALCKLIS